jgi:hypothetical protein
MTGALIFGGIMLLAVAVVLYGTWPTERDERLKVATAEIREAEAERNRALNRLLLAEEMLTPGQVAELDQQCAEAGPL